MKALSRRERILASVVLAAGALASVATSYLQWEVTDQKALPAQVMDGAQPVGYLVRAELVGPEAYSGDLYIEIRVAFPSPDDDWVTVRVSIQGVDNPEVDESAELTYGPAGSEYGAHAVSASVFDACEESPCTENLELWIDRINGEATPLIIDGNARIYVYGGEGDEPPAGEAVTLTVTPLQAPQ